MRWLVFRMGEAFAAVPKPPEAGGGSFGYTPDNLRIVPLQDGEDEAKTVAFLQRGGDYQEYLGTADKEDFPPEDEWYNSRRCISPYNADHKKNVGNKIKSTVDMDHARSLRSKQLIVERDLILPSVHLDLIESQVDDDKDAQKKHGQRLKTLRNLEKTLPNDLKSVSTLEDLKAFIPDALK